MNGLDNTGGGRNGLELLRADAAPEEQPRLTIGLPVYNGENFLAAALDSILSQTYSNFRLLISDNASTDATESICRDYASRDARVEYIRRERNVGAAPNFNDLVDQCDTPLFKWMAHDDIHAPTFVERCVELLDENPDAVLAYTGAADMSPDGDVLEVHHSPERIDDAEPDVRFHEWMHAFHMCVAVFGVVRTPVLSGSLRIGAYTASDRTLLAELSLYGPFIESEEILFYRREHPERHMRVFDDDHERRQWFSSDAQGRFHAPALTRGIESARVALRAPISISQKFACIQSILSLALRSSARKRLIRDLLYVKG